MGGALSKVAQPRLGETMWQGIDSRIVAGLAAEAGNRIPARMRPYLDDNPASDALLLLPLWVGAARVISVIKNPGSTT